MTKPKNHEPLKKMLNLVYRCLPSKAFAQTQLRKSVKKQKINFPGFSYLACELSAFTYSVGTFILLLTDGGVINYNPDNAHRFHKWLSENDIRDLE